MPAMPDCSCMKLYIEAKLDSAILLYFFTNQHIRGNDKRQTDLMKKALVTEFKFNTKMFKINIANF